MGATTSGTFNSSAPGPFWCDPEAGILYTGGTLRDRKRSAKVLGVEIDEEGALRSQEGPGGTPRLANRLLKRVRDFAQVKYDGVITRHVADFALDILDVDKLGLDNNDRTLLHPDPEIFRRSGGT